MSSDSLLIIGNSDEKLGHLLVKLGYNVVLNADKQPIPELVSQQVVDLILIDSRIESDWPDLCQYFRSDENTSSVPIICLSSEMEKILQVQKQQLDKIEFVNIPYSPGSVVSKVATQLRLRKFAGKDNANARLAEVNAALRDLNNRFMQELKEARSIQESLLPQTLPQDERFEIAVVYEPLEDVGGDWYDVRVESSGRIAVQIADATGHGLSAAFICSMTKLARSAIQDESPASILTGMNRLISQVMPAGKFITANSFVYNPADGQVCFSRAAHPPGVICRSGESREVIQLQGNGFALGFLEDSEYSEEKIKLEVNDILAVYTDGISEAQNMKSEFFGPDQVASSLAARNADESAVQTLTRLFADFEKFRDGRVLKDDVTAIILKRLK